MKTKKVNDALAKMVDLLRNKDDLVEVVEEGFYTNHQISEAMPGVSFEHVRKMMKAKIRAGQVEIKKFRIKTGSKVYAVPHYRVIGSK